jgi:hypothetical protein
MSEQVSCASRMDVIRGRGVIQRAVRGDRSSSTSDSLARAARVVSAPYLPTAAARGARAERLRSVPLADRIEPVGRRLIAVAKQPVDRRAGGEAVLWVSTRPVMRGR